MNFNFSVFLACFLQIIAIHAGGDGECVAGDYEGCIDGVPDAKYCPPGEPYVPPKKFDIPSGWEGGFSESNPVFAYPKLNPDLSSIPVTTNLANIDKLTRQMKVKWPQFSWQQIPGDESSRMYLKFAENISRLGYDDEGRMWSLICPQQGAGLGPLGEMNVEVTVTGIRGWMDEPGRNFASQIGVMGQIWLTKESMDKPEIKMLKNFIHIYLNDKEGFPLSKGKSIRLRTYEPGNPMQPLFWVRNGMSKHFRAPEFTQHWDETYHIGNLLVEIGTIIPDENEPPIVKDFNQLFLDLFNVASGNMLGHKNILAWNLWMNGPELVEPAEWAAHAEKWRKSIDVTHLPPPGDVGRSSYKRYDGSVIPSPLEEPGFMLKELEAFKVFFEKYSDKKTLEARVKDKEDLFDKMDYDVLKMTGWIKH